MSMAMTFVYLLYMIAVANCLDIKSLNKNQGVYFDQLSNLQLVRDDWKIISYYDLHPYWEANKAYDKYYDHLEGVCNRIRTHVNCDIIMIQLRHSYNELEHNNRVLLHKHTSSTRRRRGLINGVGYLANKLFGVLDDRFVEQYSKDIELIRKNQKHLSLLQKNQTSVIEAEFNVLKRTEETISAQHKIINRHLMTLDQATNKLLQSLNETEAVTEFSISTLAATNLLNHLRNIQNSLLETVTNIYNGNFNLHLIDPQQLQKELGIISGQLGKELTLPIENLQTDMITIYHLLKVKARMTEQYLIFEIRVPLISRDTYVLYNIFGVPQQMGQNMATIIPIENHVAINLQKDAYIPITQRDWDNCIARDSSTYLCRLTTPIYRLQSDMDLCYKDDENPLQCKTITVACRNKWISLTSVNRYLHFCCYQCQIKTLCQDQVAAQTLTGTNIIQLNEDCMVKTENFTIYAHKQQQSVMNLANTLEAAYIAPINNIINLSVPTIDQSNLPFTKNVSLLSNLEQKIKALENASTAEENDDLSVHDVHHYTLIYALWVVAIISAVIFLCRRLRCRWQAAAPAAPPAAAARAVHTIAEVADATAVTRPSTAGPSYRESVVSSARVLINECSESAKFEPYFKDRGTSPVLKKVAFSDDM